ncbi:MAG: glycosyltransferase family 4 protein [Thermomicrobiales bacterium]
MHVITRLNTGGATVHVVELCAALQDAGYCCTLVTGTVGPNERDMRDLAVARGLCIVDVPDLGREIAPWSDIVTLAQLYRLMRRERPDIVHTHLAKAGFVARLAARLAGTPLVLHSSHGAIYQGYFSPAKSRFFLQLERFGGRLSTRIITSAQSLRDELIRFGVAPADRIVVIPYGLEFDALLAAPRHSGRFRAAMGIPADAPLVGTVGRLAAIKNIPLLLRAVVLARQQGLDLRVVIVGGGELRQELEASAQAMGLGDAAIFAGWQPDLVDVYADLDALVLSSNSEGTPISLIEAMAAGCPVVATRVGGVADLVTDGETGRVVPAGDHVQLASGILDVFREPETTRLAAERARRFVVERHAPGARTGDMAQLYAALLEATGRA